MTTPEQPVDMVVDELVKECADRVSRSVRVTGPPNMETCEDLPNAFAYWKKDRLQTIIRETIGKAGAAKDADVRDQLDKILNVKFVVDRDGEQYWEKVARCVDAIRAERDSLRAERDEQERLKVNARKKADRVEVVKDRYREALEGIIIRCKDGDPRSDWIPIIERIATESLRPPEPDKQQEAHDEMVHCPSCRKIKIASDIETCASCEFILCNACWIKNGGCNNPDCSSSADSKENKS